MPFMYRDFCEAYELAPIAELMALPLQQQFGEEKLLGNVRQLTEAKAMEHRSEEPVSRPDIMPVQRSDGWSAKRKAELRRKADKVLAKRKS